MIGVSVRSGKVKTFQPLFTSPDDPIIRSPDSFWVSPLHLGLWLFS